MAALCAVVRYVAILLLDRIRGYRGDVRGRGRRLGLVAVTVLLAGCGPELTPLYVKAGPAGAPQAVFRACGDQERVQDLALYRHTADFKLDNPPAPLWRITAARASRTTQFTLGVAPRGFRTRTALSVPLRPRTTYAVIARTTGRLGFVAFRPEQLEPGQVVYHKQRTESVERFRKRPETDFGCYPDQQ
jgi:hypothetical protein